MVPSGRGVGLANNKMNFFLKKNNLQFLRL